jgi:hypothetical protein
VNAVCSSGSIANSESVHKLSGVAKFRIAASAVGKNTA